MAMRPCNNCLTNRWNYELLPGDMTVRATCQSCAKEVEFLTKRGKKRLKGDNAPVKAKKRLFTGLAPGEAFHFDATQIGDGIAPW